MCEHVEKLSKTPIGMTSIIINVEVVLKCLGRQKKLRSMWWVATLAVPFTNTGKIGFYARGSPALRSLIWVAGGSQ